MIKYNNKYKKMVNKMKKIIGILISGMMIAGVVNADSTFNFKYKVSEKNMRIAPVDSNDDDGDSIGFGGIGGGSVTPPQVESNIIFDKIDCGHRHCYAIKDGDLYGVGYSNYGEGGFGDRLTRTTWEKTNMTGVTDISAGYFMGMIIKDGELYTIGYNSDGQLGTGDYNTHYNWYNTGITNVTLMENGGRSSYIVKDNELFSVGSNIYGQLGLGGQGGSITTFTGTSLNNVDKISVSKYGFFVTAIREGNLYVSGYNIDGALSFGNKNSTYNIMTQTNQYQIDDISCGFNFCVIIRNGEAMSSGDNQFGQLGIGNEIDAISFTSTGITGVDKVEAGYYSSYLIKNGDIYSVGANNYGQLANNKSSNRNIYEKTEISGAIDISSHGFFVYALDGEKVYSSGDNNYGQLGLNDTSNRNTFTEVNVE